MDTNRVIHSLMATVGILRSHGYVNGTQRIGQIIDHYRKLAEREKALTEALEALVAERSGGKKHCGHEYDCICTRELVRAALALHKEGA